MRLHSRARPPCPGSPPGRLELSPNDLLCQGEAAQEHEKGRTVLLNQVDLKAPEDQPKNLPFKPHINVRSNAAGGHASAPAGGLGLQLGQIFLINSACH